MEGSVPRTTQSGENQVLLNGISASLPLVREPHGRSLFSLESSALSLVYCYYFLSFQSPSSPLFETLFSVILTLLLVTCTQLHVLQITCNVPGFLFQRQSTTSLHLLVTVVSGLCRHGNYFQIHSTSSFTFSGFSVQSVRES